MNIQILFHLHLTSLRYNSLLVLYRCDYDGHYEILNTLKMKQSSTNLSARHRTTLKVLRTVWRILNFDTKNDFKYFTICSGSGNVVVF